MINQVQKGDAIDVAAPSGGMVAGQGYLIGSMFGVRPVTAAAGVSISLWLVGVYALKENFTEAWTVGALIYWDNPSSSAPPTPTAASIPKSAPRCRPQPINHRPAPSAFVLLSASDEERLASTCRISIAFDNPLVRGHRPAFKGC